MSLFKKFWLELFTFLKYGMFIDVFVHKCRHGNKQFYVLFWRSRFVHFPSKDGKDASYEEGKGWRGCLFPARVGIFSVMFDDESTFPYLYFDLACKQLIFAAKEKV